MKANWLLVRQDYKHNICFIEDVGPGMTVTNDAEAVFNYIDENYSHVAPSPGHWRVVYKDTGGEWWEIIPVDAEYNKGVTSVKFEKWHGHEWDALKGNV